MPEQISVLFVEDDPAVRLGSKQAMELAGIAVQSFTGAEQALKRIGPMAPVVVVSDVRLPGIDGLALLNRIQAIDAGLPVILVTGHGDIAMAVQAMRDGAYEFIEKPFGSDRLCEVVRRAMEKRRLVLEVHSLRQQLEAHRNIDSGIVGRSPAIESLRRKILDLADTDVDVLVQGETGTGKELVARALHDLSRRASCNFVPVNCGGLPEQLFESEIFGHEAGAFTGASKRRIGKLEYAEGGTLFLDEIESMPMALQVKMLRVLQERQFERLGSNEAHKMNVRVVAATKSDLPALADEKRFRSDLYYRLGVVVLEIPPLRERREDVPLLFEHFVLLASARYGRPAPSLGDSAMHQLIAHGWPGNVRELRNVADRFVLGMVGERDCLGETGVQARRSFDEQMAAFERHLLEEALKMHAGRAAAASETLDLPRKTFYDKLRRHGLVPDAFRDNEPRNGEPVA